MQALPQNKQANKSGAPGAFEAADRLHSAAIHLLRRLRVRDYELGIGPAQLSALSVLVFAGPQSLASLAQAEQVKPSTMSRIVSGLLRAKLVHRKTDKQDRRAIVIESTEKGARIMQEGDFFINVEKAGFDDKLNKWVKEYHNAVQQLNFNEA